MTGEEQNDKVDRLIRDLGVPPATENARQQAKDTAWERLQAAKADRKIIAFSTPPVRTAMALAASLVLIYVSLSSIIVIPPSTRSGAGDTASETNLISSSSLTQYPAGVRTSVVRMVIGGVPIEKLRFEAPDRFARVEEPEFGVFHPHGGNATYQMVPADVMASQSGGRWYFNAEAEIANIGQSNPKGFDGNDIIAFLPGIKEGICSRINNQLGLGSAIPENNADWSAYYIRQMEKGYVTGRENFVIGAGDATENLRGQPFGCFKNTVNAEYVYYHVLIER